MARWKKLLARMMTRESKPVGYSYEDVAVVLSNLGFAEAPNSGTTHRRWRRRLPAGTVVIGVTKPGHGDVKPGYIRDMVDTLLKFDLVPAGLLKQRSEAENERSGDQLQQPNDKDNEHDAVD